MDGKELRKIRRQHAMTQVNLSKLFGVSDSLISLMETGKRLISQEEVEKFERIFNVAPKNDPANNGSNKQLPAEEELNSQEYIIYTDGGCDRNPGGAGGIGVVIKNKMTGKITKISKGFIASTNNRMEIMAAIYAMQSVPEGSIVTLYSDSQYLINTMTWQWSRKKNFELWWKLDEACEGKTVTWKWVKGHSGNKYNEITNKRETIFFS